MASLPRLLGELRGVRGASALLRCVALRARESSSESGASLLLLLLLLLLLRLLRRRRSERSGGWVVNRNVPRSVR